jgi:hypothetical protein
MNYAFLNFVGSFSFCAERSSWGTDSGTSKIQAESCSDGLQWMPYLPWGISCWQWGKAESLSSSCINSHKELLKLSRQINLVAIYVHGYNRILVNTGPWTPMCTQFPCGVHWPMAPAECQVPAVPVLCLPQPGSERAEQSPVDQRARPSIRQCQRCNNSNCSYQICEVTAGGAKLLGAVAGPAAPPSPAWKPGERGWASRGQRQVSGPWGAAQHSCRRRPSVARSLTGLMA